MGEPTSHFSYVQAGACILLIEEVYRHGMRSKEANIYRIPQGLPHRESIRPETLSAPVSVVSSASKTDPTCTAVCHSSGWVGVAYGLHVVIWDIAHKGSIPGQATVPKLLFCVALPFTPSFLALQRGFLGFGNQRQVKVIYLQPGRTRDLMAGSSISGPGRTVVASFDSRRKLNPSDAESFLVNLPGVGHALAQSQSEWDDMDSNQSPFTEITRGLPDHSLAVELLDDGFDMLSCWCLFQRRLSDIEEINSFQLLPSPYLHKDQLHKTRYNLTSSNEEAPICDLRFFLSTKTEGFLYDLERSVLQAVYKFPGSLMNLCVKHGFVYVLTATHFCVYPLWTSHGVPGDVNSQRSVSCWGQDEYVASTLSSPDLMLHPPLLWAQEFKENITFRHLHVAKGAVLLIPTEWTENIFTPNFDSFELRGRRGCRQPSSEELEALVRGESIQRPIKSSHNMSNRPKLILLHQSNILHVCETLWRAAEGLFDIQQGVDGEMGSPTDANRIDTLQYNAGARLLQAILCLLNERGEGSESPSAAYENTRYARSAPDRSALDQMKEQSCARLGYWMFPLNPILSVSYFVRSDVKPETVVQFFTSACGGDQEAILQQRDLKLSKALVLYFELSLAKASPRFTTSLFSDAKLTDYVIRLFQSCASHRLPRMLSETVLFWATFDRSRMYTFLAQMAKDSSELAICEKIPAEPDLQTVQNQFALLLVSIDVGNQASYTSTYASLGPAKVQSLLSKNPWLLGYWSGICQLGGMIVQDSFDSWAQILVTGILEGRVELDTAITLLTSACGEQSKVESRSNTRYFFESCLIYALSHQVSDHNVIDSVKHIVRMLVPFYQEMVVAADNPSSQSPFTSSGTRELGVCADRLQQLAESLDATEERPEWVELYQSVHVTGNPNCFSKLPVPMLLLVLPYSWPLETAVSYCVEKFPVICLKFGKWFFKDTSEWKFLVYMMHERVLSMQQQSSPALPSFLDQYLRITQYLATVLSLSEFLEVVPSNGTLNLHMPHIEMCLENVSSLPSDMLELTLDLSI